MANDPRLYNSNARTPQAATRQSHACLPAMQSNGEIPGVASEILGHVSLEEPWPFGLVLTQDLDCDLSVNFSSSQIPFDRAANRASAV